MINPYTKPAQMQIMNTYVPIPFQEMMAAGQMGMKRLEELEQMQNTIDTAIGQVQGLSALPSAHSNIPGYQVNEQALVEKKANYYRDRMGQVLKDNPNLLGIAPRVQLRGLINELKQDMGPTGTFGKAKQNVETAKKYYEMMQKDKDWQANPWVMSDIENTFRQFAEATQRGEHPSLPAYAGIMNKANPFEMLSKNSLDKIKETLLQGYKGPVPTGLEGWAEFIRAKGISPEKVKSVVDTELATNQELQHVLATQARWQAEETGKPVEKVYEDMVHDLRVHAANTFAYTNLEEKMVKEGGDGTGKHSDPKDLLSVNIMAAIKNPINNLSARAVMSASNIIQNSLLGIEKTIAGFKEAKGIKPGTTIGADGNDYSIELNALNEQKEFYAGKQKQLYDAHLKALQEANITKEEFEEIKKGMGNRGITKEEFENKSLNPQLDETHGGVLSDRDLIDVGLAKGSMYFDDNGVLRYKGTDREVETNISTTGSLTPAQRNKLNKYNNILKELSLDVSSPVPVTELDKFLANKDLIKSLDLTAGSWGSANEQLMNTATGDYLDKTQVNSLDAMNSKLKGWWLNPNTDKIELVYMVPKTKEYIKEHPDESPITSVSVAPPINFETYLVRHGYLDDIQNAASKQLYAKFNNPMFLHTGNSEVMLGEGLDDIDKQLLERDGYNTKDLKPVYTQAKVKRIPQGPNQIVPVYELTMDYNGKERTDRLGTLAEVIDRIAYKRRTDLETWMNSLTKTKKKK